MAGKSRKIIPGKESSRDKSTEKGITVVVLMIVGIMIPVVLGAK